MQHVTAGMNLYNVNEHGGHKFVYGADPGMIFLTFQSWALWNLGLLDQAYASMERAFEHTKVIRHPHSRVFCTSFCCGTLFNLGLWEECQEAAEEAIKISTENGFPFWLGNGNIMKGGSLIKLGQVDEGVSLIVDGLRKFEKSGVGMWRPTHLGILAEGYQLQDRTERAMKTLDLALKVADNRKGNCYEAELHRLEGTFILENDANAISQAETHFKQAIEVAQCQKSKLLELRATTSLARLHRQQGAAEPTKSNLAALLDQLDEGAKTIDIKNAQQGLSLS